jgi:hypothetical protein
MKTGFPPNRDIFLQDEAQWNTGLCVWYRTKAVTPATAAPLHIDLQGNTSHCCQRALVGTSRETITRLLSEFRRNETAELKGSTLIIHNQPALKHMVRARTALWGQAMRIMQS